VKHRASWSGAFSPQPIVWYSAGFARDSGDGCVGRSAAARRSERRSPSSWIALGIEVYEGYGLTETSPISTANCPDHRKLGSVGCAIPGVRIEIDTRATADPEIGEVIVHGPNVMKGYNNRPDENAAVLQPPTAASVPGTSGAWTRTASCS